MRISMAAATASVFVTLGLFACESATAPAATLVQTTSPDFVGVVTRNMHEEGWAPAGFWLDQYAIWVAIPPSDTGNSGVVVGSNVPVFVRNRFGLIRAPSGASIALGDSIQVWHNQVVVHGAVQAPFGAPCYDGTQVVVFR